MREGEASNPALRCLSSATGRSSQLTPRACGRLLLYLRKLFELHLLCGRLNASAAADSRVSLPEFRRGVEVAAATRLGPSLTVHDLL